ncbi:MAG: hypothetical protein ABUS56_03995 [Acidobacteriota bacterium]
MVRISTRRLVALAFALALAVTSLASAQTPPSAEPAAPEQRASIAVESDILSFFISGYSGIVNVSLPNGFQVAFGVGRYDVPSFLLEGDGNYDAAQWKATVTSVQVLRATYRFRGPMKSGPALGAVLLNQNWRLRSDRLNGETTFRPLSVGLTGGYYLHFGKHFYVYPTAAYTYNRVVSGETSVRGTNYTVEKFAPNASVHVGWEWGL